MTLRNRAVIGDFLNEVFIILRVVKPDVDESGQLSAEQLMVNQYSVLLYNSGAFELFYSLDYGGGGKVDCRSDCRRVFSRIFLKAG